ncbi:MAG: hypothetical protein Q8R14_02425 [Candidatus Omnitrophota bacterium]|nr:hypothetical protein [Candidatus Omnitrophota bacterium]
MRTLVKLSGLLLSAIIVLSGCATMRYPSTYKVEGKEAREFKDLDDDKALKAVVLIYNAKSDIWEDSLARSIALEEYLKLLKNRKSAYIKKSGIFNIKYDRVKVSKMRDDDLERLYDALLPKAEVFSMDSAPELSEIQNANRIIYLTAISSVITELKKRDNARNVISIAGQILVTALTVALQLL